MDKIDENFETDMHLSGIEKPVEQPAPVAESKTTEPAPVPTPAPEAPTEELPPLPAATSGKPLFPKKLLLVIGGIFLVLILLLIAVSGKKKTSDTTNVVIKSDGTKVDLTRYSEDPDSDRVASFIETKLKGFDPAVSELDHCFNTKCDSVNTEEIKRIPRHVMILLDSSGSMQQKVGDQSKMDSAKIAIREYLKKTSQLPSTKVGLIVYGHKGSNKEADKAESCQSAETKVKLGDLKIDGVESVLSEIQPVGYTPIGLALREAAKNFDELEQSYDEENPRPEKVINEIVIISDGVETCDTNPVAAAKELFESKNNVIVHVIGFAVDSVADNKSLRDISQAAGGTYATAPTIEELKLAMDLQWDNYVRRAREDSCRIKGYATYMACKEEKLALVNAYISSELSRDPKELPYEEKLKIDRMRYVFPAYMNGTLDTFAPSPAPASASAAPESSSSPSPSTQ